MSKQIQNLDNFIVGKSNKLAYMAIKDKLDASALGNFLILYGKSGTGKTHLLKAIENIYIEQDKDVVYATAESFLNDYIHNIKTQTMTKFQEKYRSCDLLLIDDIEYFRNKESIQEEFYHTIENIKANGGQIILTSNKHPKQIDKIEEHLEAKLLSALSIKIKQPKKSLLISFTKQRSNDAELGLNQKTIEFMVESSDKNINSIDGMVLKLKAYTLLFEQSISFKVAKKVLEDEMILDLK
jgi:chromosomal replication initiator protein